MTASYISEKFDIGILRQDGSTKIGLMLKRDKNDTPSYQVFDDEYLAQQYFTGEASYASLPPEKELVMRQDDWRSGLGLEFYDSSDPKRYHKSTMDLRWRGVAMAGVTSTAIAMPAPPSLSPGGVSSLNAYWTTGDHSVAATTWAATWAGRRFTFSATNASSDTGNGTVTAYIVAGGVAFTGNTVTIGDTSTVTGTIPSGSTNLVCGVTIGVENTTVSGSTVSATNTAIGAGTCIADFNSLLYFSFGVYLYKLNVTGDGFTLVAELWAAITDLATFTVSGTPYLFIAVGLSNTYCYMGTNQIIVVSTAAVTQFSYFVNNISAAGAATMWGSDGVNTIRSTTNPLNGGVAWSGQTVVDVSYETITGLHSLAGALYISKTDNMYYLTSAGAVQYDLAPELSNLTRYSTNGKNTISWLGNLYMPYGDYSLLESNSGVNTWVSPTESVTNASEYGGQVFALAGDDAFLYAITDNSTKVEVLAGRWETIEGNTTWVWHCINETTLTGCSKAHVSVVYQKRLWFLSTSSSDSVYYIALPISYTDPQTYTNRNFLTGTTMETPWLHGNFKSTVKGYTKLELVMGHTFNAGVYFTVKYKKLGDSSWTTIGDFTGSTTSMTQSRYIPVDSSLNNPTATMFKLQFTAVTNSTSTTPALLAYHLTGVLYPNQREIITCKVVCSNEIQLKDGTIDHGSYDTIIATLDEARAAQYPITIYDINGNTQRVKMLSTENTPRWTITRNEKTRTFEREYNLLMQIIPLS